MSIWAKGSQKDVQHFAMGDAACHKGEESLVTLELCGKQACFQGNQMTVPELLELLFCSQNRKMRN